MSAVDKIAPTSSKEKIYMKLAGQKLLTLAVITLGIAAVNGMAPASSDAQTTKFACSTANGKFATVARTKKGDIPIISWESDDFSGSGFTPKVRCQKVSGKFQSLYTSGQLKYLTVGKIRNQAVVCGTKQAGGSCTDKTVLYTLKPTADPQKVVKSLQAIRNRASKQTIEESATSNPDALTNSIDTDWLDEE
jgi:hypothetical protein